MQPYAELVLLGEKSIELRSWNTKFRGRFLVHASKKTDIAACRSFGIDPEVLVSGAILGSVEIYGVKRYYGKMGFLEDSGKHLASFSKFGRSRYGFLLKNPKRLKRIIKFRGKLNFFDFKA
jgi:ASCH domain